MTRFLHLADTHIGAGKGGFTQQPRYPEYLDRLWGGLRDWLAEHHVDFILHGGDVTETGSPGQIEAAWATLRSLNRPVCLCLGNHDLVGRDAITAWRRHGLRDPPGEGLQYTVETEDCVLFVFCLHWDAFDPPYCWNPRLAQVPLLDPAACDRFDALLATARKPVLAALHAPLNPTPVEPTGQAVEIHRPDPALRDYFLARARQYPLFKMVLAAHNHANTLWSHPDLIALTTASFAETPFDFRVVEVAGEHLRVDTFSLNERLGLDTAYDDGKAWVQGGPSQRHFQA